MSNDLNRCDFIGHLGQDPESRHVGEQFVCNFSIAVNSEWKDKSGTKQERTEWVRITAWGKLGEICQQYLTKGKQVYISGSLRTNQYEDKETGETKYSTNIVARDMQMLGGKGDQSAKPAPAGAAYNAYKPKVTSRGQDHVDFEPPF